MNEIQADYSKKELSLLKDGERIDDLQIKGYRIIQNPNWFCFGIDAVLLSNYVKIKRGSKVVDLGTGTGIIPLLVSAKSNPDIIYGVEIQKDVADMANRSVLLNNKEDRIKILPIDLKKCLDYIDKNTVDIVVSNPPYMNAKGLKNENDYKAISRHEVKCDIKDILEISSKLLKANGNLYMINRPQRLVDIIYYARINKLELKEMRYIHSNIGKAPKMVMLNFRKGAKPEVKILPPLYVYNEDGSYTDEIYKIYSNENIEY